MKTVLSLFSYGGVMEGTVDAVLAELSYASAHQLQTMYHRISGDALISRSRSRALGKFLDSEADVMIMIDHDITWRPGDASYIAKQAFERNALVGGLYCKRAFNRGWSSRVPVSGEVEFGKPGEVETPALATGFLAIPRKLVVAMGERLDITQPRWQEDFSKALEAGEKGEVMSLVDLSIAPIADGAYRTVDFRYKDYFRCIRAPSNNPDTFQFLSEDWSFSLRAVHCGFKSFLSTYPVLGHTGDYTYRVPDGMDEHDRVEHGKKQNNGPTDDKNPGAGGNPSDVRNKHSPGGRNRPVKTGAHGKARRRRRK